MSEPTVFRPIERGNYRVSPFKVYKEWRLDSTDASASGYSLHFGKHNNQLAPIGVTTLTADYQNYGLAGTVTDDISQHRVYGGTNLDGTYQAVIWQSLNHKYYKYPYDPARSLDVPDRNHVEKFLFMSASSLTIPYMRVGERVKAGSISIIDGANAVTNNFTLYDDGKGNLRDPLITSQSFATASALVGYWGFNDQYRDFKHHYKDFMHVKTGSMEFVSNTFEPDIDSEVRNIRFNHGIQVTGNPDTPGAAKASTAVIFKQGSGAASTVTTITLIDYLGLSKTYEATSTGDAAGTLLGTGNTSFIGVYSAAVSKAASLKTAIESANGHNGSITVTLDTQGGTTNDTVVLTQAGVGSTGNTTVTSTAQFDAICDATPADFTGGASAIETSGLQADFDGYSFIKTDAYKPINFDKEDDYAISFWYRGGVSQSIYSGSTSVNGRNDKNFTNALITKRGVVDMLRYNKKLHKREVREETAWKNKYPFDLSIFNHASGVTSNGKIRFKVSDGIQTMVSSSAVQCTGSNQYYHILAQKSSSFFELYIDGVRQFRASSSMVRGEVKNKAKLMFGSINTKGHRGLSGSLDEVRIYDEGLNQTAISSLANNHYISSSAYQTSVAGNIFYKYSQMVVSSNLPKYHDAFNDTTNGWNIRYKGTHTIYENEVLVEVPKGHCNVSMNPTALVKKNTDRLKPAFTASLRPYITTIGLYNDDAQLVAVAKLAQPIQKRDDVDTNFIVRWDY